MARALLFASLAATTSCGDATASRADGGAGVDGGAADSGLDSGPGPGMDGAVDSGLDSGTGPGMDGAVDAGPDAGVDGGGGAGSGYLKASNTGELDEFGQAIALSADGSTLAVGAWWEDSDANGIGGDQTDDSAREAGAVYVFVRAGATWSQQAYIKSFNSDPRDRFGVSVALSADGSTLAVGASGEHSNATGIGGDSSDNSAPGAGAVYIFARAGATWSQQSYVKASNTDAVDGFGTAVTLSGDGSTLAVGANGESSSATGVDGDQTDETALDAGAVYVFVRVGVTWTQQAYVKASNTDRTDRFGTSVALSADGSTLAVCASSEDSNATGIGGDQSDNSANRAGAVYVFARTGATWSQQAYVKASNTDAGDGFGRSSSLTFSPRATPVALSADGSTLAVGARGESSNATGVGGDQSDNSAAGAGAVYVFARAGATWTQQAYVKASNTDAGDGFGSTVAFSADGSTLAVAAVGESSNATGVGGDQSDNSAAGAGAVYVFARAGATWTQQAYVKASNADAGDGFGSSVALSADGSTVAVGADSESSNATGVGGDQGDNSASAAGAVYVHDR